jgi:hypothetical protein
MTKKFPGSEMYLARRRPNFFSAVEEVAPTRIGIRGGKEAGLWKTL